MTRAKTQKVRKIILSIRFSKSAKIKDKKLLVPSGLDVSSITLSFPPALLATSMRWRKTEVERERERERERKINQLLSQDMQRF